MNHTDHVHLLREAVPEGGVWADFGSGGGAFTLALADLLGPTGRIWSVEKDAAVLNEQKTAMQTRFPAMQAAYIVGDFRRRLPDIPPLDGLVMANSLHFVRDKMPLLALMTGYLKPGGRFVLVEYNTDIGNTWVPYPLTYSAWEQMARQANLTGTRKISAYRSRFLNEIYSALSLKPR